MEAETELFSIRVRVGYFGYTVASTDLNAATKDAARLISALVSRMEFLTSVETTETFTISVFRTVL